MQLGELQQQARAFADRGVTLVAISVDDPADARPMIQRLGLEFPILSDADFTTIRTLGLENPEVGELALHATLIVDRQRRVLYRKLARRRPYSRELLDAIDFHRGTYDPQHEAAPSERMTLWKGWTLLEAVQSVERAPALPDDLDADLRARLAAILVDLRAAREDPALVAWRALCRDVLTDDNAGWLLQLGRRLMYEAYLQALDYQAPLDSLVRASAALDTLRRRRAQVEGSGRDAQTRRAAIDLEIGAARNALHVHANALGNLSSGHRRSLWDLKSMLKAMEELHAAEVRAKER